MLQNLDVISFNLWQVLISLLNLTILFLVVKFLLFGPIKKVLAKRQAELDAQYAAAASAEAEAKEHKMAWEEKRASANAEADAMIQNAADTAKARGEKILSDAKERAEGILRTAEADAALERQKAVDSIRKEIVEVSGALAEKMLEREINREDHRALIDSFIENVGGSNDGDQ